MKIAVASEKEIVTDHFGHCKNFNMYDTKSGEIIDVQSVENPGHQPGYLPNFLNDLDVDVIISGGMGGAAVEIFNDKDIEVILGASGDANKAVEDYLAGKLKSTGSVCHQHQHEGEC